MTTMNTSAAPDTVSSAGRAWLGLAVLALPALLVSLDLSVLLVALPELSAHLGASGVEQLWITDIYGFMVAGFLVTMGTLGDRIGRRRVLLIGAAAFGVASIVAAFSVSPGMLIAARVLLGIAGATLMPSALALVSTLFTDPRQRGTAIAALFSCIMVGGALGPVIGGALLAFFWWGSVFLIGVPVMAVLLLAAPRLVPESRNAAAGRIDPLSVALSLAAILPFVYGLKDLAKDGVQPIAVGTIVAGVVMGIAFVARQRRLTDPLLDLGLFRHRSFSAVLVVMLLGGIVMGGTFLLVTQYLQLVQGLAPLLAGLATLPATVAMLGGIMTGPALAQRMRPGYVMALGMVVAAAGLLVVAGVADNGLALVIGGFTLALFGMGLPGGLGVGLVIGSAPPEQAGSASSISETSQELGMAFGLAGVGSLAAGIYRTLLADGIPGAVPADMVGTARESIAGAAWVADTLPEAAGRALLVTAQATFTTAMGITMAVSAVTLLALAVLAAVTLKHLPATGASEVSTDAPTQAPAAVTT
ncbi:MAG: MFS transporter [Streptosporangiales bacterium]|nr:MFS transporter [Streptosporangiales bacterium]